MRKTLRAHHAIVFLAASLALIGGWGLLTFGCAATGDPENDRTRQIVAAGALIALDLDDLQRDDATPEEKARFADDVQHAIGLVGIQSDIGQHLALLLADYAAGGSLDALTWRDAVRVLLEWASTPPAEEAGPPRLSLWPLIFPTLAGRRYA